jgi:hypothetical protein
MGPLYSRVGRAALRLFSLFIIASSLLAPGWAAPCVDDDGDGFTVCDGCDPGSLECGECNDRNDLVNPGASEICGDGLDNDCDSSVDFGLNDVVTIILGDKTITREGICPLYDPPDCRLSGTPPLPPASGCCVTLGVEMCTQDRHAAVCVSATPNPVTGEPFGGPITTRQDEGPAGSASCFDGIDNNCNGMIDHAESTCVTGSEVCNGYDDNGNGLVDEGLGLGQPCTAGTGACRRDGATVCSSAGGTTCSAQSASPSSEGPPRSRSCTNHVDDDCDGAVDVADEGCQQPEICDGRDNNHDGVVDEGFSGLGSPCTSGAGVCSGAGIVVCDTDGLAARCSGSANLSAAKPEGPVGETCHDGFDNDCDGFTDEDDPVCRSGAMDIDCALAYEQNGPNGSACEGWHRIRYEVHAGQNPKVSAELLALDLQRNVLGSLPVENGDIAHLRSNVQPGSWKWFSQPNNRSNGTLSGGASAHDMAAPVTVLHVMADDGVAHREAFCSPVPYVQVMSPRNTTLDGADEEDLMKAIIAVPLIDPASLDLRLDGVDLLDALEIDSSQAFPGESPGGTFTLQGAPVEITDIKVDIAPAIGSMSSNTISFLIKGLGCGTHGLSVSAHPAIVRKVSGSCYVDSYRDEGLASVFDLDITTPQPGQIVETTPVPVQGTACHGRPIAAIDVNGASIAVGSLVHTPGDATGVGEQYVATIDTTVERTNLFAEMAGKNVAPSTFDPGSNRVMVSATDDQGHRVFRRRTFASGTDVRTLLHSREATKGTLTAALSDLALHAKGTVRADGTYVMQSDPLPAALVVGMTLPAIQTFADAICKSLDVKLKKGMLAGMLQKTTDVQEQKMRFKSGCDPTFTTVPSGTCNSKPTPAGISCRYIPGNPDCEGDHVYLGKCLPPEMPADPGSLNCKRPDGTPGPCGHCEKDPSVSCENFAFGGACYAQGHYGACIGTCMGGESQGQDCANSSACAGAPGTTDDPIACAPHVSYRDGAGNETEFVCRVEMEDGSAPDGTAGTLRFVVELPHITTRQRITGGCSSFWSDKTIDYEIESQVPHPGSTDQSLPLCTGTHTPDRYGRDAIECDVYTPSSECTPIYAPGEDAPKDCAADDEEDECTIPPQCPWSVTATFPEGSLLNPDERPSPETRPTAVGVAIVDSRTTSFDCGIGCIIFLPLLLIGIVISLIFGQFWLAGKLLGPLGKIIMALVLSGSFPNLSGTTIVLTPALDSYPDMAGEIQVEQREFLTSHIRTSDTLDIAKINSHGIVMGHSLLLDPTRPDPEVEGSPGYLFTPSPLPIPPVPRTDRIFGLVSDDFLNQKMSAMTRQGQVKSGCSGTLAETTCCPSTPAIVAGDLFRAKREPGQLPATSEVCDEKAGDTMTVKDAAFVGTCLGVFAADLDDTAGAALCEAFDSVHNSACADLGVPYACCTAPLEGTCDLIKNTAQGVCHGVRGANCNQIPLSAPLSPERALCAATRSLHVRASDPVLNCARNDIPPRILLSDVAGTPPVESFIRLNDLLMGIVIDRNRDGMADTILPEIPKCLDDGTTADCRFMSACLDVNLETALTLKNEGGTPKLSYAIGKPIVEPRPAGALCEGQVDLRYGYDSGATTTAETSDTMQSNLQTRVSDFIPSESLGDVDLRGTVSLAVPKIVALKTTSDPGRCFENLEATCTKDSDCGTRCIQVQDYIGITGTYEVPPAIAAPKPALSKAHVRNGRTP